MPSKRPRSQASGQEPPRVDPADVDRALIVLVTVPDEPTCVKLTDALLQQRLAACIHRLPAGLSTYHWAGRLEQTPEILLVIKTRAARWPELLRVTKSLHSHETPEILCLSVADGLPAYLDWLRNETA